MFLSGKHPDFCNVDRNSRPGKLQGVKFYGGWNK